MNDANRSKMSTSKEESVTNVKTYRTLVENDKASKESLRRLTRYEYLPLEVPPSSHKFIIPYGIHYKQEPRVRVQLITPKEEDSFAVECSLCKISLETFTVILHNSHSENIKVALMWESFIVSQV